MKEKIKKWFNDYRLKHHTCEKHGELVESHQNIMYGDGCGIMWTTSIYKCKICGKRYHID